jgi:hypothetical protein
MTSFGDEPLGASLEPTTPRARVATRRKRRRLLAPYPGIETSTQPLEGGRWGPAKTFGFIFGAGALLWALIIGALTLLH